MAAQILETRRYNMLGLHYCNRDADKLSKLEESMRKYGWLDAYPAHVVKEGNYLRVKAGHHRIAVAKKLGIPVKYVICDDGGVSIFELEHASNAWTANDYLSAYCKMGMSSYLTVRRYVNEGIPIHTVVELLATPHTGDPIHQVFRRGDFEVRSTAVIDTVLDILYTARSSGVDFAPTTHFVKALAQIQLLPEVDLRVLKKKIKTYPQLLRRQVSVKDYLLNLEAVYNRMNKSKVHIAALAEEVTSRLTRERRARNLAAGRAARGRKPAKDVWDEVMAESL